MDILLNGGHEEKTELTFFMVDVDRKGWFSFDEFSELIFSILLAWNDITSTHIRKWFFLRSKPTHHFAHL